MKILQAVLVGGGCVMMAAVLNGGIYTAVPTGESRNGTIYVINKFTGAGWVQLANFIIPVEDLPRTTPETPEEKKKREEEFLKQMMEAPVEKKRQD